MSSASIGISSGTRVPNSHHSVDRQRAARLALPNQARAIGVAGVEVVGDGPRVGDDVASSSSRIGTVSVRAVVEPRDGGEALRARLELEALVGQGPLAAPAIRAEAAIVEAGEVVEDSVALRAMVAEAATADKRGGAGLAGCARAGGRAGSLACASARRGRSPGVRSARRRASATLAARCRRARSRPMRWPIGSRREQQVIVDRWLRARPGRGRGRAAVAGEGWSTACRSSWRSWPRRCGAGRRRIACGETDPPSSTEAGGRDHRHAALSPRLRHSARWSTNTRSCSMSCSTCSPRPEPCLDIGASRLPDPPRRRRGRRRGRALSTEREADVQSTQEALLKAREYEEQLIGVVSHDLRNPLSIIMHCAELMRRTEHLPAPACRQLQRLRRRHRPGDAAHRRPAGLHAGAQSRRIPVKPVAVDLQRLLQQVIDEAMLTHPGRAIERAGADEPDGRLLGPRPHRPGADEPAGQRAQVQPDGFAGAGRDGAGPRPRDRGGPQPRRADRARAARLGVQSRSSALDPDANARVSLGARSTHFAAARAGPRGRPHGRVVGGGRHALHADACRAGVRGGGGGAAGGRAAAGGRQGGRCRRRRSRELGCTSSGMRVAVVICR